MTAAGQEALRRMGWEYQELTGRGAYLYAYSPGDGLGKRYVFTGRTCFGLTQARGHMRDLLASASRQRKGGNSERGEHQ